MNSKLRIMNFRAINYFILLTFSFLLFSCSPQYRLHRLVTKHPELSRVDTIKTIDTVIVPGIKTDTVFHSSVLKDTITITKEKLKIRLIEINDTIYLDAIVEPDTVIIIKEILVDRIVHIEPVKWWVRYWWVLVILLGITTLLLFHK